MRRKTSVEDFHKLFGAMRRTEESMDEMDDGHLPAFGENQEEIFEAEEDDQPTMVLAPAAIDVLSSYGVSKTAEDDQKIAESKESCEAEASEEAQEITETEEVPEDEEMDSAQEIPESVAAIFEDCVLPETERSVSEDAVFAASEEAAEQDREADIKEDIVEDMSDDDKEDIEADIADDDKEDIEADISDDDKEDVEADISDDVREDVEADIPDDDKEDVEKDIEIDTEQDVEDEDDIEDEDEKIQPINEEIAMFFANEIDAPAAALHIGQSKKQREDETGTSRDLSDSESSEDEAAEVQKLLDHEAAQDLLEMEEADARYREKRQKRKNKKKKSRHLFGKFLSFIQAIISVVTIAVVTYYDLVPEKYLIFGGAALGGLFVLTFIMQYKRGLHILGKLISLILSTIMVIGIVYLGKTMSTLETVTAVKNYQTDKIAVAVLADSKYETIEDVLNETFGVMTATDKTKIDQAISQIEKTHNVTIHQQSYNSYADVVNDLYSGKIKVMVYNQAMNELIEDQHEGFLEKIRVLETEDVQTEIYMNDVPDLPLTTEPFIVYLSGLDVYDGMEDVSRSDVNIIACVNPVSKQILLVSVPRDAYVSIPGVTGEGGRDKLTHAGMYGVNYSIAAMENIFDVDISYYGRINFTAFLKMVDALGGVDVDSDYAFSTYYKQYDPDTNVWEYFYYDKGTNHLDGRHALAFARERMNSAIGDYQRARNQEKVISALVAKLQSPAVLTGYTDLLASMEGHVDTNFTMQQLASLVKMQLNDGAHWNIVMSSVYGYASSEYCASYSEEPLDVEILDEDSVEAVKEVIADLIAGKVIGEPRKTDIQNTYTMTESDADSDYYLHQHASDDEYDDFYWQNGGAEADGSANAPEDVKRKQQEMQQQQEEAPPAEEEYYEEEYYE